jgi:hypothetical protein
VPGCRLFEERAEVVHVRVARRAGANDGADGAGDRCEQGVQADAVMRFGDGEARGQGDAGVCGDEGHQY